MITATMAKARPRAKNPHIRPYAGENHDFLNKGTTMMTLPITAMILLWIRYQKSASPILPIALSCMESAKALYPGIIATMMKSRIKAMSVAVSYIDTLGYSTP